MFLSRRLIEKVATGEFIGAVASGVGAVKTLSELVSTGSVAELKVIFLDVNMPELDGLGVLRWIRAHDKLAHVKTIMLSTSDDPRDVSESLAQGAHCYLIKLPTAVALRAICDEIFPPRLKSLPPFPVVSP